MNSGIRLSVLPVVAALGVFMAAATIHAGQADRGMIYEVDDSELADMRGRYVSNGRVIALGVHMSSTFQTRLGDVYRAGIDMGISLEQKKDAAISQTGYALRALSESSAESQSSYAARLGTIASTSFPTLTGGTSTTSIPTSSVTGSSIARGGIPESSITGSSIGQLTLDQAPAAHSGIAHVNTVEIVTADVAQAAGGVSPAAVTTTAGDQRGIPNVEFVPHFSVVSRTDTVKEVKTGIGARIEAERGAVDVSSSSRLESVTGVAQGIQISGDGNTVDNNLIMDVTVVSTDGSVDADPGAVADATVSGTQIIGGGSVEYGEQPQVKPEATAVLSATLGEALADPRILPSDTLHVETERGVTINAGVVRDGLQVEISVPDQGQLTQKISSGFAGSLGGIRQFTAVPGHLNVIRNDLRVITVLQNREINSALDIAGTRRVMESLRDIGGSF